jgi:signal peptidase II
VATESQPPAQRPRLGALALVVGLALTALGLDQLAKYLVIQYLPYQVPVPILGPILEFVFVRNSGAAFSLGSGLTWIFALLATTVAVVIVIFARRIRSLAWATVFGLLLGGTLGNLLDRLFREPGFGTGHVIDFIKIWGFPAIFNVADIAITGSMVVFVLLTLLGVGLDGTRRGKGDESAQPDSSGPSDGDA